ncbi:hypothetical protein GCM10025857_35940 [Alicyclobacillus contaminans]|uniref:hypothetical protein n=1 Tax=Alicyclobacillus contaminans TaxID=392016 RepID=UPI00041418FF|nr:hypothetical protein [Alicyclobacillus contaminans]GMA52237.1 hypothetical protein GCM10025857_35940 [Alicyclobacillus contaminans]
MSVNELLRIEMDGPRLIIDARSAIQSGRQPRNEILTLVGDAPIGTLCEVHVPNRASHLIAALESMGMNVVISEVEPGHWRLRMMKL